MVGMSGHAAVKAVSPQAPMTDTWMGDDFFHQGAFRLSYGLEYSFEVESDKAGATFDVGVYDMYEWYLRQGTLGAITARFGPIVPSWRAFVEHPAYDQFWQTKAVQKVWTTPNVATLTVGGWWDQEDFFGPLAIYAALEKNDTRNLNRIAVGPWNHGQWAGGDASRLGKIDFKSATGPYFRERIQAPFFAYYLKDTSPLPLAEATVFETGSNTWRSYEAWPPRTATRRSLYLHAGGTLSFEFLRPRTRRTRVTCRTRPTPSRTGLARFSRPTIPPAPTGIRGWSRISVSWTTVRTSSAGRPRRSSRTSSSRGTSWRGSSPRRRAPTLTGW
jgi:putative CocE/NonD family hydrolase